MLRIGKLTDYALLVMGQMAKTPASVLSAALLAETLSLTTPTVSKVLKILSDAGLVNSVRGAEGGYHLAKNAEEITVADILAAMEGEFAMTVCTGSKQRCAIDSMCTMKKNWQEINRLIYSFLDGLSITDMLQPLASQRLSYDK